MIPLFRFSSAVFPVNCRERDGQLREEGRAQVRGGEPPQLQGERAWDSALIDHVSFILASDWSINDLRKMV